MTGVRRVAALLAVVSLVASASFAPAVAGATADRSTTEAYSGTHVAFETTGNAVVDYTVDGETLVENVSVESQSAFESRANVDADAELSAVTELDAAGVSLASTAAASATVSVESGAEMAAHDNEHGILVVRSGDEAQLVTAELGSEAEASAESDGRVTVTTGDGAEGTFMVVGDGEVTVNEDGDVVADVGSDGKLVFRAYPDGERSDDDRSQERLIANGSAVGEVYVMANESGEVVTDTVTYGEETTISASQSAENTVNVTVDRASSEGKVLITQVSEAAVGSLDDLSVTVDGEAAAEASSYSEVAAAAEGDDGPAYMVRQSSAASGSADVVVGIDHFSERTVSMSGSDGGDGGENTSTSMPGFGAVAALVALAVAGLVARS